MPEFSVKNLSGEEVDTITVSDQVFGVPANVPLMHQAVQRILADQRRGTHKAKTRGEVTGSRIKIIRQKGTGGARHGSKSAPIFVGGGVAFPPVPRSYAVSMPKKMRRQATRSALSSRVVDGAITVVSSLEPVEPRTKHMMAALQGLSATGKVLLVDEQISEATRRSARNIEGVSMKPVQTLNIVDVLDHDFLIFSVGGLRELERKLSDGNV